ncbi:MAG: response regulator transcription factor [Verrucomicrobiota bacterium]
MIRIALVDDHRIVRDGLVGLFNADPRFELIGQRERAEDFYDLCRETLPDVAVVDISMPVVDGFDLTETLVGEFPDLAIILLTARKDPMALRKARASGARGLVLKDDAFEDLAEAVIAAYRGETKFSPERNGPASSSIDQLANREIEVLSHISRGRLNKEIAASMGVSLNTVRTYRARLMEKLNIRTGPELVRFAMEHGLE